MKKIILILFVSALFQACFFGGEEPQPQNTEEEPRLTFPDPSPEDVFWSMDLKNTKWSLDSAVNVESVGNSFKMNKETFENNVVVLEFNDSENYFWNNKGKISSAEYEYNNRTLLLDGRTHSLRAVVINLDEKQLAFCYNTSSINNDVNGREMYFFSRK